jgi:hypothetical protein
MLEAVLDAARSQAVGVSRGGGPEIQAFHFGSAGSLLIRLDRAAPVDQRLDTQYEWWRIVLVQYSEDEVEEFDVHGEMLTDLVSGSGVPTGEFGYVPLWNFHLPDGASSIRPGTVIRVLERWVKKMEMVSQREGLLTEDTARQLSVELAIDLSDPFPEEVGDDPGFSWEPQWLPHQVVP